MRRRIAEQLELVTAKKKDSTGICFIGERKLPVLPGPAQPGPIVSVDGQTVANTRPDVSHWASAKGWASAAWKDSSEDPWYVVDKDVANNVLVVAIGARSSRLMSVGLIAQQLHWVDRLPERPVPLHGEDPPSPAVDIPCTVTPVDDERIEVRFDEPVSAVTPGQSAVFYRGEIRLGGGIIEQRRRNREKRCVYRSVFIQNSTCAPSSITRFGGISNRSAPVARCAATAGTPCRECANTRPFAQHQRIARHEERGLVHGEAHPFAPQR